MSYTFQVIFKDFFLCEPFFEALTDFVTILLLFYLFGFLTLRKVHWTTRKSLHLFFKDVFLLDFDFNLQCLSMIYLTIM